MFRAFVTTLAMVSAALPVVPIPGVSGPDLQISAVQRTTAGGGIFVWKTESSAGPVIRTAQIDADGALLLAYGNSGIASLPTGGAFTPTALAIDPSSGAAWIGGSSSSGPEVIALGGDGSLDAGFGNGGVLNPAGAASGGVAALSWSSGKLLIAAGTSNDCTGCALSVVNPISGEVVTSSTLTPGDLGGAGCTRASVTSAAFASAEEILVGARVSTPGGSCSASVLALSTGLAPLGKPAAPTPGPSPLGSTFVSANSGSVCVAGDGTRGLSAGAHGAAMSTTMTRTASASLVSLVPIGGGACGALVRIGSGSAVFQVDPGHPLLTEHVNGGVAADAMFRCHQHLLVLGTQPDTGGRSAVVLPVPIGFGPNARTAHRVMTTGCT